jgi:hypothetical protein
MPKSAHLDFNDAVPDLNLTTAADVNVRLGSPGGIRSLVRTYSNAAEIVALARGASREQPSAALAVAAQ